VVDNNFTAIWFTMKKTCITLALVLLSGFAGRAEDQGILEDQALAWRWNVAGGHLSATLVNKADGTRLELSGECFELQLGDGRVVKAADFKPEGVPHTETLPAEPASPNVARHFAGRALIREFSDVHDHLTATWQASLRNGTTYVQQELTLRATGGNVWIKAITLFDQPLAEGRTVGVVDGSPVVVGTFFCGCENPMAENRVSADHEVSCRLTRNAELKDGETLSQGFVLGVAEPGQIRRGVLAYINSARAHPTRPFCIITRGLILRGTSRNSTKPSVWMPLTNLVNNWCGSAECAWILFCWMTAGMITKPSGNFTRGSPKAFPL